MARSARPAILSRPLDEPWGYQPPPGSAVTPLQAWRQRLWRSLLLLLLAAIAWGWFVRSGLAEIAIVTVATVVGLYVVLLIVSGHLMPEMARLRTWFVTLFRPSRVSAGVKNPGGVVVGRVRRGPVTADPEQAVLVLGPPRRGKTTGVVIPTVRSFRGPVVSTSTKLDVLQETLPFRRKMGRVWLFDPSGRETVPSGVEPLRWSPVAAAGTWDSALLVARAMVETSAAGRGVEGGAYFAARAGDLLAPLLHTAALTRQSILDVFSWVNTANSFVPTGAQGEQEPITVLDQVGQWLENAGGAKPAVEMLAGIVALGQDSRERASIFSTATVALSAYASEGARKAAHKPNFGPEEAAAFVRSTDTVFITSTTDDQELNAPLIVGLLTAIKSATYERARADSKPTAPVLFALDELANIAPLPDISKIVSQAGGQGLQVLACLQDLSQVRQRWDEHTADGFLSLFQEKLILPGIQDPDTLEALSLAVGEYDRVMASVATTVKHQKRLAYVRIGSYSLHEGTTETRSVQRERYFSPSQVANIPRGRAIYMQGVDWHVLDVTPVVALRDLDADEPPPDRQLILDPVITGPAVDLTEPEPGPTKAHEPA